MKSLQHFATVMSILSLSIFAAACGGSGTTISCTATNGSYCIDYTGSGFSATTAQTNCTSLSGSFSSTAACSTTNRAGTCAISAGSASEEDFRYYTTSYTASTAQSACTTQAGTFTAN